MSRFINTNTIRIRTGHLYDPVFYYVSGIDRSIGHVYPWKPTFAIFGPQSEKSNCGPYASGAIKRLSGPDPDLPYPTSAAQMRDHLPNTLVMDGVMWKAQGCPTPAVVLMGSKRHHHWVAVLPTNQYPIPDTAFTTPPSTTFGHGPSRQTVKLTVPDPSLAPEPVLTPAHPPPQASDSSSTPDLIPQSDPPQTAPPPPLQASLLTPPATATPPQAELTSSLDLIA